MNYYTLELQADTRFNSMHKLEYTGWKPRLKLLSDFDIVLSEKSTVYLHCNSEKHVLMPGEAFIAHPGQSILISEETTPKAGVWVVHFSCPSYKYCSLHDILDTLAGYNRPPLIGSTIYLAKKHKTAVDRLSGILGSMEEELKFRAYGYESKMDLLLVHLLYELHRSSAERVLYGNLEYNFKTVNSYVRKMIDYLHANCTKDIKIADVESFLNLNYDYANTIFKKMTGYTVMNYLDTIRHHRIKELLESTSLSLHEISALVGSSDPHYLSKKFKKKEGISPSEYRKRLL